MAIMTERNVRPDGTLIGTSHENSMLNTALCYVQFHDKSVKPYRLTQLLRISRIASMRMVTTPNILMVSWNTLSQTLLCPRKTCGLLPSVAIEE